MDLDPISLMPEAFLNEEDMKLLDKVFDRIATESRWSNKDVARAITRLIHYIVGNGDRSRK